MSFDLQMYEALLQSQDAQLAQNKRLVAEFLGLVFNNQIEPVLSRLSPDVGWWVIGRSSALKVSGEKNREQVEKLLHAVARALPQGMHIELLSLTAEAQRVAAEVQAEGRWVNGKLYQNRYHFLFELGDGRISRVHEYMDTLHLFEVMQN